MTGPCTMHAAPYHMPATWFLDTGAMHYVTLDLASLHQFEDYYGYDQLHIGNSKGLPIAHSGNISPSKKFHLNNVLYVPSITKPLMSVKKFTRDNNVFMEIHPSFFCVEDQVAKKPLLTSSSGAGLYHLPLPRIHLCFLLKELPLASDSSA